MLLFVPSFAYCHLALFFDFSCNLTPIYLRKNYEMPKILPTTQFLFQITMNDGNEIRNGVSKLWNQSKHGLHELKLVAKSQALSDKVGQCPIQTLNDKDKSIFQRSDAVVGKFVLNQRPTPSYRIGTILR